MKIVDGWSGENYKLRMSSAVDPNVQTDPDPPSSAKPVASPVPLEPGELGLKKIYDGLKELKDEL